MDPPTPNPINFARKRARPGEPLAVTMSYDEWMAMLRWQDRIDLEVFRFAQDLVEASERAASYLRPMNEAPTTGPVLDILASTTDRYGNRRWLVVHYAFGGGEEQPPFRGWFYWSGHGHSQIEEKYLVGWVPLPELPR